MSEFEILEFVNLSNKQAKLSGSQIWLFEAHSHLNICDSSN